MRNGYRAPSPAGKDLIQKYRFPIQPPPLRGTSFHRKEGVSTLAPSLGRGCRAHRGGVGFLFCGARVLSYIACLRRSPPLFFIPLVSYPARFARHLPHAGKALLRKYRFPIQPPPLRGTSFQRKEGMTTRAPSLGRGCRAQRGGVGFLFAAKPPPLCLPHWGRGTASAALGCFRKRHT